MGTLYAQANYTNSEGRINIEAKALDDETSTDVNGYVDLKHSYINLPIFAHDTSLAFI